MCSVTHDSDSTNVLQARARIVQFDFDRAVWKFDAFAIQNHLTTVGMDAYFEWLQNALPVEVKDCINALSLLPAQATDIGMLAAFLDKPQSEIESLITTAAVTGVIRKARNGKLKFSHDRQRVSCHLVLLLSLLTVSA